MNSPNEYPYDFYSANKKDSKIEFSKQKTMKVAYLKGIICLIAKYKLVI